MVLFLVKVRKLALYFWHSRYIVDYLQIALCVVDVIKKESYLERKRKIQRKRKTKKDRQKQRHKESKYEDRRRKERMKI